MDFISKALELLPDRLCTERETLHGCAVEEIRLRPGYAASAIIEGRERSIGTETVSRRDIQRVLEKATGASLHAYLPELCSGYISYGGIRIGVCGTAVIKNGAVCGFKDFSSLNLRIPALFRGNIDRAAARVMSGGFSNTLIVSPPGGGKTTALRELICRLSQAGYRISVVDERNELSATDGASAAFELGEHSDVLVGVKKNRGALMLLRGMNPEIIAMDEITESEDINAIHEVCGCGVGLIATAHASSAASLGSRALYRSLLENKVFENIIEISGCGTERSYVCRSIYQ